MKKKTIIICAVILLLVIAFFPFKTVGMKNKDGVISQIKSLTYCIQKIHREVPAEEQDYELVKPYEDGIVIKILGIEVYNDVPNLSKPVEAGIDPEDETKKELCIERAENSDLVDEDQIIYGEREVDGQIISGDPLAPVEE